jgi:hypothetical protein
VENENIFGYFYSILVKTIEFGDCTIRSDGDFSSKFGYSYIIKKKKF